MDRNQLETEFHEQAEALDLDVDVISSGPVNSDIAIVGEGLGENEVRQKTPFIGGAGRLLWDALRKHDLNRVNVYTTNVVKRQISLSRRGNERHVVYRDELERWTELLLWELSQLPNLKTILILGNYALEALTQNSGITNWRGSVLDIVINGRKVKVVCTINPAYAIRDLKMEVPFLMDCRRFASVVRGTYKVHEVETEINPTAKRALEYIRELKSSDRPVSFDIEVVNMETACYGLTNNPHFGHCISLRDGSRNRFTIQEEADILLALQSLCESHSIIAQNGSFDAYWCRLHDFLCVDVWFDTLLAHHTLYPQLPHSLAFLVGQYTTHPYYKDEGKFWREGGDIDQFWRYNCTDAALTYAVYERLTKELKDQNLDKFFYSHVMRAQPHLVSATVHGVAVDLKMKETVTVQVAEEVAKLKAEFHRLVHELVDDEDYYPNPDSWQQLRELFFDTLGLVGRGKSTDRANRDKIVEHAGTSALAKEMITILNRYSEEKKFLGTYAESKPSRDGRFRCVYKQFGVSSAPGRLSSAALLDGTGGNMQNQPPRARAMYTSDPGTVFIYFDLKQAESQVVAYRARIETWKEQYKRMAKDGSYDAHRALAAEMWRLDYDDIPKEDFDKESGEYTKRYIAKRCRHGLNYRMQKFKLAEVTGLPFHEAAKAYALYHRATPELQKWWREEERLFRHNREAFNAFGRRNKVIQRLDDEALKSVVAFYPQSTIGDKITKVWYQAEEDDKWPFDARVAIDVHDNLIGIATPRVAKTALAILKRYAEEPIMIRDCYGGRPEPLSIPAECKISVADKDGIHRWSNLKEIEL